MGALKHLVRLLAAVTLGFVLMPYAAYRALQPVNAFIAAIVLLGLVLSLPVTLGLLFYGKVYWSIVFLAVAWLLYLPTVGLYMAFMVSSTVFMQGAWIPVLIVAVAGAVFLTVFLKRGGISLPLPEILRRKQEDVQELGVEDVEEEERLEEAGEEEEPSLPAMIASLDDVQCRILMSLLSFGQFSKKELQERVNATYKRTLKAVNGLEEMRLVEVKKLPRRAKGAPVMHVVKVSPRMLRKKDMAERLIRERLEELSPRRLETKEGSS